jgi:hypothetical protein
VVVVGGGGLPISSKRVGFRKAFGWACRNSRAHA